MRLLFEISAKDRTTLVYLTILIRIPLCIIRSDWHLAWRCGLAFSFPICLTTFSFYNLVNNLCPYTGKVTSHLFIVYVMKQQSLLSENWLLLETQYSLFWRKKALKYYGNRDLRSTELLQCKTYFAALILAENHQRIYWWPFCSFSLCRVIDSIASLFLVSSQWMICC